MASMRSFERGCRHPNVSSIEVKNTRRHLKSFRYTHLWIKVMHTPVWHRNWKLSLRALKSTKMSCFRQDLGSFKRNSKLPLYQQRKSNPQRSCDCLRYASMLLIDANHLSKGNPICEDSSRFSIHGSPLLASQQTSPPWWHKITSIARVVRPSLMKHVYAR